MVECEVLDLTVETVDQRELGLGASIGLALVENLLCDFMLENGGGLGLGQDTILANTEDTFEQELGNREPDN